jgi:hypothetical protein
MKARFFWTETGHRDAKPGFPNVKEQNLLFRKKKKQKDFCFLVVGVREYGTWPGA